MAANAEPTVYQRGEFDWMCMRHRLGKKHPLGEHMYLFRHGREAVLICEDCARKVSEEDLDKYEAKDFEVFKRNITRNLEYEGTCHYEGCKNKASCLVEKDRNKEPIPYCQNHFFRILPCTFPVYPVESAALSLLQAKTYNPGEDISCWRVVLNEKLKDLKLDLTKLVLPDIPTKSSNHPVANLFQRILVKEIERFIQNYHQENVTFTNALHYCTLRDALFKLNALINHPQECEMLEDTTTSGGGAPTTIDENKDKTFTVGKGKHVSVTVTENPEECKPYLSASGFIITITKIGRVEDRLEVDFDLEMTEQTRWAASAGLHREPFMIGYTHTITKRCFCTEGFAIATPDNVLLHQNQRKDHLNNLTTQSFVGH